MIETPTCPVCSATRWREIGRRTYALGDRVSDYARPRYRVLFEVWFPGRREITLRSCLCEGCGFVTYTPRPSAADVDAKYRFLGEIGTPAPGIALDAPIELKRAAELHRHAMRHAPRGRKLRILDYGGGDGRLMRPFLAAGHSCEIIDYTPRPIAGLTRIADTEAGLSSDQRFDLIIACHVIEHVAEPLAVISTLRRHLTADGTLYVEVPMEIWGKAPLHEEPVTHVNFFTPASCRHLFAHAGLGTVACTLGGYLHESGRTNLAVRIHGQIEARRAEIQDGRRETESFLAPSPMLKLKRHAWMPGRIPGAVAGHLKRVAG